MRYANWGPGFPDSHGSDLESCVNLFSSRSYVWNDASCYHASCFVCELDL